MFVGATVCGCSSMKRRERPQRVGCAETVRKWVRQAQIDAGIGAGVSSQESAEVRKLRAEVRELRRANEILKAAAGFFAAELDRPQRIS